MNRQLSHREVAAIMAKKNGQNWSPVLPFERENIKLLDNMEGNYELYDKDGKRIYVGSSYRLKHRVQSYDELDDFKVHPTKRDLRPEISSFRFRYLPIHIAREHEQKIKQTLPFNMDSKENHALKRKKFGSIRIEKP